MKGLTMEKTKLAEEQPPQQLVEVKINIDFKHDPLRAVPGFGYDKIPIKKEAMNGSVPIPTHRAVPQAVLAELSIALFQMRQFGPIKPHAEHLLKLIANHVKVDQDTVPKIVTLS